MLPSIYRFSVLLSLLVFPIFILTSLFLYGSIFYTLELKMAFMSSMSFTFAVNIDYIALLFSLYVIVISSCVYWFASSYMSQDLYYYRFMWLLLLFVISMNFLIFSKSIFFLLMGWDGLGITSFVLIIYYASNSSLSAGFLTLMANRLGDVVIIVSMSLMVIFGEFLIFSLKDTKFSFWYIFLIIAAMTKSAQYPFSAWLPAAMAAPTPVSALVHSSTLVTAGVYLMIRLMIIDPLPFELLTIIQATGSITCFLAGFSAMFENDLKKIIALSTLSQLGVMVFSLGINAPDLAFFHLLSHASFKAMLFLCAGLILMNSFGVQDLRLLGGVLSYSPIISTFFNISNFCLIAMPFLSSYYSKHLILEMSLNGKINMLAFFFMIMGSVLTACYVVRSIWILQWSTVKQNNYNPSIGFSLSIPLIVLGLLSVCSGKLMSSYNLVTLESPMVTGFWWWFICIMPLIGFLFFMLMFMSCKNSFVLTSLLFLSPSMSSYHLLMTPVMKITQRLESGWLEPTYYTSPSMLNLGLTFNELFFWPSVKLQPLMRGGAIFMVLLVLVWFFY